MKDKYKSITDEERYAVSHSYDDEEREKLTNDEKAAILKRRMELADDYIGDKLNLMSNGDEEFEERKKRIKENIESPDLLLINTLQEVDVEQKIGQEYAKAYGGKKTLSDSEKSKRAKQVQKKQDEHLAVLNFERRYVDKRDNALFNYMDTELKKRISEGFEKNIVNAGTNYFEARLTKNNPVFDVFNDWAAYYESVTDPQQKQFIGKTLGSLLQEGNRGNDEGEFGPDSMLRYMEKVILPVDVSIFDYKTNEEFIKNLDKNYPMLKALASSQRMLDYIKADKKVDQSSNICALRAKASVFVDILADYESRIKMMSSPYYVLLAKKDLFDMSLKDLEKYHEADHVQNNPELKSYVESVMDRKKATRFKRGDSASDLYEKRYKTELKSEYDNTKKTVNEILKGTKYKSVKAVNDDPKAFHQAFTNYWMARIWKTYKPEDFAGTFAKTKAWEGRDADIKRLDQKYENYFVFEQSRKELTVFTEELFRPEKASLYSEEERADLRKFKDNVLDARDKMCNEFDLIMKDYTAEINPEYWERIAEVGKEVRRAQHANDKKDE